MMLEYSFNLNKEAEVIRKAVKNALEQGYGTKDITKIKVLSTTLI